MRRDDYTLFCERYVPELIDDVYDEDNQSIKKYDNIDYKYQEALDKAGEGDKYL